MLQQNAEGGVYKTFRFWKKRGLNILGDYAAVKKCVLLKHN
jgi:hypothetical protein